MSDVFFTWKKKFKRNSSCAAQQTLSIRPVAKNCGLVQSLHIKVESLFVKKKKEIGQVKKIFISRLEIAFRIFTSLETRSKEYVEP